MNWTFGICFGENPEYLRKLLDSIYKQNIPNYEILIAYEKDCPEEFKNDNCTWIKTSLEKKLWLTKKKNDIIKSAKYDSICMLHDYLLLDDGWYDGYNKFGYSWNMCSNPTLDPSRNNARIADWLILDHPRLSPGAWLLPYDVEMSDYQFLSGMYFCINKKFILDNDLFFDENLTWFSGYEGGQYDDQEWSKRARKLSKFSFNINSKVYSLKPKTFNLPSVVLA